MAQNDPDECWKPPGPMDFLMGNNFPEPFDKESESECNKCKHPKKDCRCKEKGKPERHGQLEGCCEVVVEEDICVEAKISIKPDLHVGKIKIECLDTSIEKVGKQKSSLREECVAFVNQIIRVKIPLKFSTCVDAHKTGVICKNCEIEDCDC